MTIGTAAEYEEVCPLCHTVMDDGECENCGFSGKPIRVRTIFQQPELKPASIKLKDVE